MYPQPPRRVGNTNGIFSSWYLHFHKSPKPILVGYSLTDGLLPSSASRGAVDPPKHYIAIVMTKKDKDLGNTLCVPCSSTTASSSYILSHPRDVATPSFAIRVYKKENGSCHHRQHQYLLQRHGKRDSPTSLP